MGHRFTMHVERCLKSRFWLFRDDLDRSACPEKPERSTKSHEPTRTNATLTGVPHRGILYTSKRILELSFL